MDTAAELVSYKKIIVSIFKGIEASFIYHDLTFYDLSVSIMISHQVYASQAISDFRIILV